MRVVVPRALSFKIKSSVLDSIRGQDVGVELVEVCDPDPLNFDKRSSETAARNKCLAYIKGEEYAVMNDADTYHLRSDNLSAMLKFLEENRDWGGVVCFGGLIRKSDLEPQHLPYRSLMMRKEAWDVVNFERGAKSCTCESVSESVRSAGFRYGYLDSLRRVCEI